MYLHLQFYNTFGLIKLLIAHYQFAVKKVISPPETTTLLAEEHSVMEDRAHVSWAY